MSHQNIYITCNDAPSGIYKSQVIDTVNKLNEIDSITWRLIALLPLQNFFKHRKIIKRWNPKAIILPMFPKLKYWANNSIWIKLVYLLCKPKIAIGRGAFATNLALDSRKSNNTSKVIYDGRGAFYAECEEYQMVEKSLLPHIKKWESTAIIKSDYRIAVSQKLVDYWQEKYFYSQPHHQIIPCTIGAQFEELDLTLSNRNDDKIRFVYAGGGGDWQSLDSVCRLAEDIFKSNSNCEFLFLSKPNKHIDAISVKFPNKVFRKFVNPEEVPNILSQNDYGILIREKSITNKVASPTKFAEYLACGLSIIISPEIGDFSEFVVKNKCGLVWSSELNSLTLEKINSKKKENNRNLALQYFSKQHTNLKKHYLAITSIQ